jgi:NADH dehydrogenase FAD-containing subunit
VALSRFNENNRAEVTNTEYLQVLIKLFSYIEQYSQGRTVNIPLIGGGHGGVNLPAQKLLEFLLLSMLLQERLTLVNGVNIVLHESVKERIDLVSINELVKVIGV